MQDTIQTNGQQNIKKLFPHSFWMYGEQLGKHLRDYLDDNNVETLNISQTKEGLELKCNYQGKGSGTESIIRLSPKFNRFVDHFWKTKMTRMTAIVSDPSCDRDLIDSSRVLQVLAGYYLDQELAEEMLHGSHRNYHLNPPIQFLMQKILPLTRKLDTKMEIAELMQYLIAQDVCDNSLYDKLSDKVIKTPCNGGKIMLTLSFNKSQKNEDYLLMKAKTESRGKDMIYSSSELLSILAAYNPLIV